MRPAGQGPVGSNIGALFYATGLFLSGRPGFLLGRLLRNILILLRFLNRNKRLRISAFDRVSSNQLVSKPQGKLR